MLLYWTNIVNLQGFNSMKLNGWKKSASKKYHLQMTRRVWERLTDKLQQRLKKNQSFSFWNHAHTVIDLI